MKGGEVIIPENLSLYSGCSPYNYSNRKCGPSNERCSQFNFKKNDNRNNRNNNNLPGEEKFTSKNLRKK
jgi:hypothetical protein